MLNFCGETQNLQMNVLYFILVPFSLQLWFTADNGGGSITSKYIPKMNNALCDGNWHSITGNVLHCIKLYLQLTV